MKLLLVEDEDAIRSAMTRGLTRMGHIVESADSLTAARNCLESFSPEALLTDLKLPDGKGLELAGELGIPFIVMSGFAGFDDAVKAMRLGCVDFFTKPVSIRDVHARLEGIAEISVQSALSVLETSTDGLHIISAGAQSIQRQQLVSQSAEWNDSNEAEERWSLWQADLANDKERQVLAELMQCAPSGKITVNYSDTGSSFYLDASVDWVAHAERKIWLEEAAHRSILREHGCIVECGHG